MRWAGGDAAKREKQTPRFGENRFTGECWREPQRKRPCPLALPHSKRGRCRSRQPWRGLSAPPLPARAGPGGSRPAGRREGRGGTSAGTGAPPGWLCLCVSRLLVTEPFSSACEMSVVTELRPTKKGPFTVHGGEVKKKQTILLKSKYSF